MSLKRAFTLIELLVVIAIIGILSGLIIVGMNGMTDKANIAKSQVFSNSLRNALMMSLLSEWSFDNITDYDSGTNIVGSTAGNIQDSWRISHGTANGGPILRDDCADGKCLEFSGSNYVALPFYFTKSQMESGMTWSLWIKHSISDSTASHHYQVMTQSYYGGGSYERAGSLNISNKRACFSIYDGAAYRMPCGNNTNTGDNRWHFVVVTVSPISPIPNLTLTVYTDTVPGASINSNQGGDSSYMNLRIAQSDGTSASILNYVGLVDDVGVFTAPMPASWIKEQYYIGLNRLFVGGGINEEEYLSRIGIIAQR
ncbi:MAG: LamG-like jellyroll fold domain-containing protein [Candidatus Paceibacterota bacterium]|jgi:prepilin-type N-terminal cleavage/methylation domain-containing protein